MGKAWVKARKHDRFYRAAKRQSYRSRAAIKLSQIDLRYGLFEAGDVVVDLGAAPGGWSQLAQERIGPKGRVIAVDLAQMSPIEGVQILRGDFQRPEIQAELFETLRKPADVVMSDMAPKLSGLSFAVRALRRDGRFLVKVFQGDGYRDFVRRVGERFEATKGVKPTASSATSAEIYVLAIGRL